MEVSECAGVFATMQEVGWRELDEELIDHYVDPR